MIKLIVILLVSFSMSTAYGNEALLLKLQHSRIELLNKLAVAKANGYGHAHPRIKAMEEQLRSLEDKIQDVKAIFQEVVIRLEGDKSTFMKGHPQFGKTETAIQSLMIQGWRIKKIIPAGAKGVYVWMIRNE